MTSAEVLRRRRCLGLRIAVVFGLLLAAFNRKDPAIVAVAAVGIAIALVVIRRDCRRGPSPPATGGDARADS